MNGLSTFGGVGLNASQFGTTCQADFFKITAGFLFPDAENSKGKDLLPRIGDVINFDESYLFPIEVEDIMASLAEHEKGESKVFSSADEAIAWLHAK